MEKFGFDYITIEVDETRAIYPIGRQNSRDSSVDGIPEILTAFGVS